MYHPRDHPSIILTPPLAAAPSETPAAASRVAAPAVRPAVAALPRRCFSEITEKDVVVPETVDTLEWVLDSPPPLHQFEESPIVVEVVTLPNHPPCPKTRTMTPSHKQSPTRLISCEKRQETLARSHLNTFLDPKGHSLLLLLRVCTLVAWIQGSQIHQTCASVGYGQSKRGVPHVKPSR